MADIDFKVKNGLIVNTSFTANSTQFALGSNVVVNTSAYFVGNSSQNNFQSSSTLTISNSSSNVSVTATGINVLDPLANASLTTSSLFFGNTTANVSANNSALFLGNTTANVYITPANLNFFSTSGNVTINATGFYINSVPYSTSADYVKGNYGTLGSPSYANNIFRINTPYVSNNIQLTTDEYTSVVGPLVINTGYTLTLGAGSRLVII